MIQGQIITFYSYKGGVGRSMALANVAVLLSRWGYRTLIVDWDLEAPGLEYFFKSHVDLDYVCKQPGLIDLLTNAAKQKQKSIDQRASSQYITSVPLPDSKSPLQLLTAGKRENGYFDNVRNFDIDSFYSEGGGGPYIESLRNNWKQNYDFVLIDSRTGITDIGGICTIQLPDILVLLFTATDQGFRGALDVAYRASQGRQQLPVDRLRLLSIPIATRLDTDKEFQISQQWLTDRAKDLQPIYKEWIPKGTDARALLEATKLPYISYFSFGERLAVYEQASTDPAGLSYAYETLAALLATNLEFVDDLLTNRSGLIAKASRTTLQPEAILETGPVIGSGEFIDLLKAHSEWLSSGGARGKRLTLKGAAVAVSDIPGTSIVASKSVLPRVDMSKAFSPEANFSEADLSGSIFRDAVLEGANFDAAQLAEANLAEANLAGATMRRAKLINADLRRANLHHADLSEAQLQGSKLADAIFDEANLSGADVSSADVRRAFFRNADVREAIFLGAAGLKMEQFSQADLTDAKFDKQFLQFGLLSEFNSQKFLLLGLQALLLICPLVAISIDWFLRLTSPFEPIGFFINSNLAIGIGLFIIYFLLQLRLYGVWIELSSFPAIFPDGEPLSEKVRPKFVENIVNSYSWKSKRRLDSRVAALISKATIWYLAPAAIVYLAMRCWLGYFEWNETYRIRIMTITLLALGSFVFAFGLNLSAMRTLSPRGFKRA